MTIYEQIERSIEYLEKNLINTIYLKDVAKEAGMSIRSFTKYFWMITGYKYKEYLVKRRLAKSATQLLESDDSILTIAVDHGYSSNEAFTRSFKKEFTISPIKFRELRPNLDTLGKIQLYKEKYMGVIVKSLDVMNGVCFDGFGEYPENKARKKMENWLKDNNAKENYRIFGHNIDLKGELSNNPENEGYRFIVITKGLEKVINSGRFIVTGIEGDIGSEGEWIKEGWGKLLDMAGKKNFKIKEPVRWYEEELKSESPKKLRLDLYLEIE